MAQIAYVNDLGEDQSDWMRVRMTSIRGQVTEFTVQYETEDVEHRRPVIRYDTAHGFAHADVMNRRGELVAKTPLPADLSFGEALQSAINDVKQNWREHRRRFFEEEQ